MNYSKSTIFQLSIRNSLIIFTSFCRRKNLKRAVGAACIGGGQGIAVLIERV